MKTAISLPDLLFHDADELAKELGISRSQLYQRALVEFLEKRRAERRSLIAKIDEVCERVDMEPDEALYGAQLEALPRDDEW